MTRKSTAYSFQNDRGFTLYGTIDHAAHKTIGFGVFAPCFTCTQNAHAAFKVCRELAALGITMLRFDMTGLGQSEGDFADTNFSTRVADIVSACEALGRDYSAPSLLIGHSISGTASLAAAHQIPTLKILATLGAPADPVHIVKKFEENDQITWKKNGYIDLAITGYTVTVKAAMLDNMRDNGIEHLTANWKKPLYIFQAPNDDIVAAHNAETIYHRATCEKYLISLGKDATHLLDNRTEDAAHIAETLVAALK